MAVLFRRLPTTCRDEGDRGGPTAEAAVTLLLLPGFILLLLPTPLEAGRRDEVWGEEVAGDDDDEGSTMPVAPVAALWLPPFL